jgi:ribokinase
MDYWISNKRKDLMCVIEKIDILLLNDNEARQLFDEPNLIRAGRKALNAGPEYVIIKKGEHGALAFANDWFFSAPSYPLENLIDPTGAGDSFAGALIGCLAKAKKFERKNIKKAIIYASAVASFVAEDFSTKKLEKINTKQIEERFLIFKKIREF